MLMFIRMWIHPMFIFIQNKVYDSLSHFIVLNEIITSHKPTSYFSNLPRSFINWKNDYCFIKKDYCNANYSILLDALICEKRNFFEKLLLQILQKMNFSISFFLPFTLHFFDWTCNNQAIFLTHNYKIIAERLRNI